MRAPWIATALIAAACGNPSRTPVAQQDWVVTARAYLPTEDKLAPFDPSDGGGAPGAEALAYADGYIFVAYANLYEYAGVPAGPSWISVHDPTSLDTIKMIELELDGGPSGEVICTNAGAIAVSGDNLLIACAGQETVGTMPNQGKLAIVSASQQTVTQITPTGGTPGAIVQAGNNIWLGDSASPSLLRLDATTYEVLDGVGAISVCPVPQGEMANYPAALLVAGDVGYAACNNSSTIQEFDPNDGGLIGAPVSLGTELSGPTSLASIAGDLAIVGSTSSSIGFSPLATMPIQTPQQVVVIGAPGLSPNLSEIAGDSSVAGVTNSEVGSLDILDVTQQFQLVAAVSTLDSPDAGSNDPYGVIDVNGVFYVTIPGWTNPPELLRIARADGGM